MKVNIYKCACSNSSIMFIFGHLGITLGIFFLASLAVPSIRSHLDYRFIAVGALLPDLIDKPIGRVLFANSVASGYLIAHSLVFFIVISIVGYALYRERGDSRIIQVAGASFLHLVEDRMWKIPVTLLWPALGWEFPYGGASKSFMNYVVDAGICCCTPRLSVGFFFEAVGALVLVVILVRYLRRV
jgi:hypothetical protein